MSETEATDMIWNTPQAKAVLALRRAVRWDQNVGWDMDDGRENWFDGVGCGLHHELFDVLQLATERPMGEATVRAMAELMNVLVQELDELKKL